MTQVWMVRNSDTDIHLFNRHEHLEPSVRISYGACKDVVVTMQREVMGTVFTITGKRRDVPFEETIEAKCFSVWTEPCHL